MSILIVDYGMGNLASVKRAIEECGGDAFISNDPEDILGTTHIVLPGVGSYADGMNNLQKSGWIQPINKFVNDGLPLLGICLGMQLLATKGFENGETEGLGLIPGEVRRLSATSLEEKIPHVGWNEIFYEQEELLFHSIPSGTDFYFVHSYHFVPLQADSILTTTPYCGKFVSSVQLGNIMGVQFHPEKSSQYGFQLLHNFLSI